MINRIKKNNVMNMAAVQVGNLPRHACCSRLMTTHRKLRHVHVLAIALWIGLAVNLTWTLAAALPPVVSQLVYVQQPLTDEYGQVLEGTDPQSSYFGIEPVEGTLVQIFQAVDGVVYPPNAQGQPDARNVLLLQTRVGLGAAINQARPGVFSAHLSPRPMSGTKIFVRVFNASDMADASFYKDSQLFSVSWTVNTNFNAMFSTPMRPLDQADDDGDGIVNSWEKSAGTDAQAADTDGDGIPDGEEAVAGTSATSADSMFVVANMIPVEPDHVRLTWSSSANRIYTIQRREGLNDDADFITLHVVNGNGREMEYMAPGSEGGMAFYRIKVELMSQSE